MKVDSQDCLTLELTDSQQREYTSATGLGLRKLVANRMGYTAMSLAAEAVLRGTEPPMGCPITLVLTDGQAARLATYLSGPPPAALTFDADGGEPQHKELWPDSTQLALGSSYLVAFDRQTPVTVAGRRRVLLLSGSTDEAWGSGGHATTRLCAELLESVLRRGDRVADIGSGSGILTVVAALGGAASVDAFEIDPNAAKATLENSSANGVSQIAKVHERRLDADQDGPFDLTAANLLPRILIDAAADLARVTRRDGLLIFSGVVPARFQQVEAALSDAGFTALEMRRKGMWCAGLMGRR